MLNHPMNWWQARTVKLHPNRAIIATPTAADKPALGAIFLQDKSRQCLTTVSLAKVVDVDMADMQTKGKRTFAVVMSLLSVES